MPDPLTTAATAWARDKYGKSLTDKLASAAKGRRDKFRWSDAAEKYRAKIKKLYGTMQIMGMPGPGDVEESRAASERSHVGGRWRVNG